MLLRLYRGCIMLYPVIPQLTKTTMVYPELATSRSKALIAAAHWTAA